MFEEAQEKKQSGGTQKLVMSFAVVAAIAVGVLLYTMSKGTTKLRAPVASAMPAPPSGPADPVHDLRVFTARMQKDRTGTTAVWLVDISNKSKAYTYSGIQYETTYIGSDNRVLTVNKGTMTISLEPGEGKNSEVRDVLYPAGTTWYRFKITGATAKTQ
jgi:hypothetical protein